MQHHPWNTLSVEEINHLMKDIPISWWIAGGWALDLHYGKQTRKHEDMDILISSKDFSVLKKYLNDSYEFFIAYNGILTKLEDSEKRTGTSDSLWVRKKHGTSWLFEIMLIETEDNEWIYKRDNQIRRPVNEIGITTNDGIPYIKPEIQLLYKGGSSVIREKDNKDLERLLPVLKKREIKWLYHSLSQQFNGKHPWLETINNKIKGLPVHALIIGGTGMISGASLWLADSSKVSIVARNEAKMDRVMNKSNPDSSINPLFVDYRDSAALKEKIKAAIIQNGPIDLVIAWIHSNSNNALDIISYEVAKKSPSWKLYHVLGSNSNLNQMKNAAAKIYPGCQYRQIQLGFILGKEHSRWLTNQEISHGIIDAVAYDREVKIIGTVEPWEKRP
ncbi:nucleotidyltransferase domain-containing protein [Oceanobacillus locisalsi]|uniref:Nucleotidyltransferase domain-containing protein n=1 Tax=Oceanobacillus locisalsi TaxID=546107 RepID=A0ABW3NDE6_9BACI